MRRNRQTEHSKSTASSNLEARAAERRHLLVWAAVITAVTITAYLPALRCGFIWDDDSYVTDNPTLHDVHGLGQIWLSRTATPQYYPLVFTSFWIEHQLWGLHPAGYHLINILLHAASVILLWRVLNRLAIPGALAAALVFAVHPVHVESVAWITERKNVLSGFFFLASIWFYIRFTGLNEVPIVASRIRFYILALACFVCALLSKSVTASMPAVMLLLIWWKHGRLIAQDLARLVPFFLLGGLAAWNTSWLEKYHVGTQYVDWQLGPADRIVLAGRALWFYLGKLVAPANLTFIYPRWEIRSTDWWQWLFPVAWLGGLAFLFVLRKRIGSGPLVAMLLYSGVLLPALGFVDVYPMRFSYVADHFQYLASIGPIVLICALLSSRLPKRSRVSLLILLICALSVLTWRQISIYRDLETLWRDTISKNPESWMAHGNLAAELAVQGRSAEAIDRYREALRLKPDAPQVRVKLADLLEGTGQTDEAIAEYIAALKTSPNYADAHNNFGLLLANLGRTDEAQAHYRQALEANPDYVNAWNNLGNLLRGLGRAEEAMAAYEKALTIQPDHAVTHLNLGSALMVTKAGKGEAMEHFTKALRSDPSLFAAHDRLGLLLAERGEMDAAIAHFKNAIRIKPDFYSAQFNLGIVYLRLQQPRSAIPYLEQAARLDPASEPARQGLSAARQMISQKN